MKPRMPRTRLCFFPVFQSFARSKKNAPIDSLTREVFIVANHAMMTANSRTANEYAEVGDLCDYAGPVRTRLYLGLKEVGCSGFVYFLHTVSERVMFLHGSFRINCVIIRENKETTTYIRYILYTSYTDKMIGKDFWYSEPDNNRRPYAFILVKTQTGKIVSSQIACANSARIVEIKQVCGSDEKETMRKIIEEIHKCERNTLLITHTPRILHLLRNKILQHNLEGNFRGLQHLCIQDLLEQYFVGYKGKMVQSNQDPKSLWELFVRIAPLLPSRALRGDTL